MTVFRFKTKNNVEQRTGGMEEILMCNPCLLNPLSSHHLISNFLVGKSS